MTDWSSIAVAVIAAAASLTVGLYTSRSARRAQSQTATQQQLQWALERLDKVEARERLRDDYIHQLRDHIARGKPPPPPPWPDGLTDTA